MNLFKLKEFNEDRVVYLYQPEGNGEWGEVIYIFADQTSKILKRAGESSSMHDHMAQRKIKERIKENNLPIEFTQAWY